MVEATTVEVSAFNDWLSDEVGDDDDDDSYLFWESDAMIDGESNLDSISANSSTSMHLWYNSSTSL